jgi:hypothetical protein
MFFPLLVFGALFGFVCVRLERRFSPGGVAEEPTEAARPNQEGLGERGRLLLLAAGFPVTLLAAAVWAWLARGELAPGEAYEWDGWLVHWAGSGSLAGVILSLLGLLAAQAVRAVRALCRPWLPGRRQR